MLQIINAQLRDTITQAIATNSFVNILIQVQTANAIQSTTSINSTHQLNLFSLIDTSITTAFQIAITPKKQVKNILISATCIRWPFKALSACKTANKTPQTNINVPILSSSMPSAHSIFF